MSDMDSGIVVARWCDSNAVHITSKFVGVHPVDLEERWCSDRKARKEIDCPQIIICYNKGMDGVDLANMLIPLNHIAAKTKRLYLNIFWHCNDMAKVNAWLLYDMTKRSCKHIFSDQGDMKTKFPLFSF